MSDASLTAVGVICSAVATITTNFVILLQILRTKRKVEDVHKTVNGRMEQLLHETEKRALLEGAVASDTMEDGHDGGA